jgi:hypothetical protein
MTICDMSNDNHPKQKRSFSIGILVLRVVAVLVFVAGVVVAFVVFSHDRVCNQQLTAEGKTVEVCRHLQATDPPIIVVGLVILAALSVFFPEISISGLSLKRDVANAKDAAQSAKEAAESASRTSQAAEEIATSSKRIAEDAETASKSAQNAAELAEKTSRNAQEAAASAESVAKLAQELSLTPSPDRSGTAPERKSALEHDIRELADEYNEVRDDLPTGTERTSKMTSIVSRMISLLNNVGADQFDVTSYLNSNDPGLRLSGYAYLYANPDPNRVQQIAAGVLNESQRFLQYWALRTLHRQVERDPDALDLNTRRRLTELLNNLGPGTDRAYELRQILQESPGKASS